VKRTISLVTALTLLFLMMFASVSIADEIKVPISASASDATEIGITIKVSPAKTNMVNCSFPQEKATQQILQTGKQTSELKHNQIGVMCGECCTLSGAKGIRQNDPSGSICVPCAPGPCP
jgi:hypothetical protein